MIKTKTTLPGIYEVAQWMLDQGRPLSNKEVAARFDLPFKASSARIDTLNRCTRVEMKKVGESSPFRYQVTAIHPKGQAKAKPAGEDIKAQRIKAFTALLTRRW